MVGPTGSCESVVIGDTRGNVIRLSLPRLELLDACETSGSVIRSICRVSNSSDRLLVGDDSGHVWLIGRDVPDNFLLLFKHDECITSIRTQDNEITIQSGWSKYHYDWEGVMKSNYDRNELFYQKKIERTNRRARLLERKGNNSALVAMLDLPMIS